MRTSQVIVTTCVLAGAMLSTAAAQGPIQKRGDRGGNKQAGHQQFSRRGGPGMGGGGGMMSPELMRHTMIARFVGNEQVAGKLGLTDDQTEQIKDSLANNRKKQIRLSAEQEIAAMEQVRLLAADDIDEEAIMAAVEKTGDLTTELAKLRIEPIIAIKKILTPGQLANAREMIREYARGRRGHGQGRRMPPGMSEGGRSPEGGMMPPPPPPEMEDGADE